jgi:mRNA-degrading endonuclease RelE of RelBE toxin-antitoxin system
MKITVNITENFKREAKSLLKKYPSFKNDLLKLEKDLTVNPKLGTPLGNNCYKIRIKIKSKGKGKSGGARIISLVETDVIGAIEMTEKEIIVNLISVYDKSVIETISNKELKDLINQFFKNKI